MGQTELPHLQMAGLGLVPCHIYWRGLAFPISFVTRKPRLLSCSTAMWDHLLSVTDSEDTSEDQNDSSPRHEILGRIPRLIEVKPKKQPQDCIQKQPSKSADQGVTVFLRKS